MQIRSSQRPVQTAVQPTESPKQDQQDKVAPEKPPEDSFQPGQDRPDPTKKLLPAMLALGGAAAGLVGGLSNGVAGGVGGALSMGAAGASAATLVGAFEELSGTSPDYAKRAAVGGALGVAFGALVGSLSQSSGVAAGLAVAGTIGATLGYSFLQD